MTSAPLARPGRQRGRWADRRESSSSPLARRRVRAEATSESSCEARGGRGGEEDADEAAEAEAEAVQ